MAYLGAGEKDCPEAVEALERSLMTGAFAVFGLQAKESEGPAEQVREVVQQDQPVSQHWHMDSLQVTKLHGNLLRQSAGHLASHGGPGEAVGGATGHMVHVDLIGKFDQLERAKTERSHQPYP